MLLDLYEFIKEIIYKCDGLGFYTHVSQPNNNKIKVLYKRLYENSNV